MNATHYRLLVAVLVGLLATSVAVTLAVLDQNPVTAAIRDAAVAFVAATTLCLLMMSALKGGGDGGTQ
ncbi:hypothetical protein ACIQZN_08740 [Streptomyces sp. NPDC097595]|uniref:hypothetical protein n=1 Tax=Streptomyces sp. NPDC097595 TaxID=3366090 RepID=UPI0037F7FA33